MKPNRNAALILFIAMAISPCFAHHLAVVVDKSNKTDDMGSEILARIYRSEMKEWPSGTKVVVVMHKNSAGETSTLQHLTGWTPEQLKANVLRHRDDIKMADSDADVLKLVESTPGSIALVDVRSINDSVNIVKVDHKLPNEEGYLPH